MSTPTTSTLFPSKSFYASEAAYAPSDTAARLFKNEAAYFTVRTRDGKSAHVDEKEREKKPSSKWLDAQSITVTVSETWTMQIITSSDDAPAVTIMHRLHKHPALLESYKMYLARAFESIVADYAKNAAAKYNCDVRVRVVKASTDSFFVIARA